MASNQGVGVRQNPTDYTKDPNYRPQTGLFGQGTNDPGLVGLLNLSPDQISAANNPMNSYFSSQQQGPYRGGLQSNFNFTGPTTSRDATALNDNDADVRGAANSQWELQHPGEGTNSAEQQALYNMYSGRIGQKNSLAETIANSDKNLRSQEDLLTGAAGQSLGQGLKNTRENYNSRGLLYSGMRQGGEQQVKQGVASSLNSGISGAKRDASNSRTAAQNAYMAVDMANAQESLNLAHQAFDTATQNSIARMQAMQQLGHGVGAVAGTYFGSRQPGTTTPGGGAAAPSGPSYYDTSATNNYYDYSGGRGSEVA